MTHATFPNLNRAFYLPRLTPVFYQGSAVVHWELNIAHRRTGWLNENFHALFRETILHACSRQSLLCPTYCLMPDHIHLIFMGLRLTSDQRVAMAFLRTHLQPGLKDMKFQHQAYDHVLGDEERLRNAFGRICGYILDNPIRSNLVSRPGDWPYSGSVVPGYPTLHPLLPDFWRKFWSIYQHQREPATKSVKLPPRITLQASVAADVRRL